MLTPQPPSAAAQAITVTGYSLSGSGALAIPWGAASGNDHRTLSTYLNGLIRAGFVLDAVEEPKASDLLMKQQPLEGEVPIFFACRAIRDRQRTPSRWSFAMLAARRRLAGPSPCDSAPGVGRALDQHRLLSPCRPQAGLSPVTAVWLVPISIRRE